jgi:hypothetical protein
MNVEHSVRPIAELADEIEIRWLKSPWNLRYLRQTLVTSPYAARRPASGQRLFGYAIHRNRGRSASSYQRRIFFLQISDLRGVYDHTDPPSEAVCPWSIQITIGGNPPEPHGRLWRSDCRRVPPKVLTKMLLTAKGGVLCR